MNVIGLTGTIGSGKSTVSKYLQQKGYKIIDADKISKELMKKGEKGYKKVVAAFSEEILDDNKEIDRKKLSDMIFSDCLHRSMLNEILHPIILEQINREIQKYFHLGEDLVFLDAPLLIETAMHRNVDKVMLIKTSKDILLKRIEERDNISIDKAKCIMDTQMPEEEKEKVADYIIENNQDLDSLYEKIDAILDELERF